MVQVGFQIFFIFVKSPIFMSFQDQSLFILEQAFHFTFYYASINLASVKTFFVFLLQIIISWIQIFPTISISRTLSSPILSLRRTTSIFSCLLVSLWTQHFFGTECISLVSSPQKYLPASLSNPKYNTDLFSLYNQQSSKQPNDSPSLCFPATSYVQLACFLQQASIL